jgi:hypothetical protein
VTNGLIMSTVQLYLTTWSKKKSTIMMVIRGCNYRAMPAGGAAKSKNTLHDFHFFTSKK